MADFKKDAQELLDAIGGKKNVSAVTHCATRMRFVLNDPSKADKERIEDIESVKGTFTQAGQFQVIVGNRVGDFYNEFSAVSGLEGVSKDEVKGAGKKTHESSAAYYGGFGRNFHPINSRNYYRWSNFRF